MRWFRRYTHSHACQDGCGTVLRCACEADRCPEHLTRWSCPACLQQAQDAYFTRLMQEELQEARRRGALKADTDMELYFPRIFPLKESE